MSHKHDKAKMQDNEILQEISKIRRPSCDLEGELFASIYKKTPDSIKSLNLIDLSNKNEFIFKLKKEHLYPYDKKDNLEGLNLYEWLENYEKEAKVSTAGIRGPQNVLFPQDTRFPINLIGITLATLAKALVIKEKGIKNPTKLAAREVRYNSDLYLDAIARIQAANGIKTILPTDKKTIPIWMASFLVYKLGLAGGEYITSSHGISVKNATKDLNSQGGQYLPEESMEFVEKIRKIFVQTEKTGFYDIKFSSADNPLIDTKTMESLDDGVDLYIEYLKTSVARNLNMGLIRRLKDKIVIENVGGCAYRTLSRVLKKLEIEDKYYWLNTDEDPFFHSIGKYDTDPKGKKKFYDYSVDAVVVAKNQCGETFFPVIESLHYDEKLKDYPIDTVIMITDPDHDRITLTQIESAQNAKRLSDDGIEFVKLSSDRILAVYSANQAFLMLMDCRSKKLKQMGAWDDYPLFIVKTTASSTSWDEWAQSMGVKVVNVPVGFKEIANIMKKVEKQISENPDKEVVVHDVFDNAVNLGVNPRLLFAGEESGGMIVGPGELIVSKTGYKAVSMREKSATEAIIGLSGFMSRLQHEKMTLSQYFVNLLKVHNIKSEFDAREDISYYNESEPDIKKLIENKLEGEEKRTKNDLFYLTLAMALKQKIISMDQVKEILKDTFCCLDFSDLKRVNFVGDGTYFEFENKFIEIRPSGTDAKTKIYAAGIDKEELDKFCKTMGYYSGKRTDLYKNLIPNDFYNSTKSKAMDYYLDFVQKDF